MKSRTKKPRSALSLTTSLAIAFLTLIVFSLAITVVIQIATSIQAEKKSIANRQQVIAQDAAHTVANFVQEKASILRGIASLVDPFGVSEEDRKRILSGLLRVEPAFTQTALLGPSGQALSQVSRRSLPGSALLAEQFDGQSLTQLKQGESYIGPIYIEEVSNEPHIVMAVPVINPLGDFAGLLVAEVNLKFMWDLVDRLQVGEAGDAYVVDRKGYLIAFSDTARVLKRENLSRLQTVQNFIRSPASAPVTEVSTYSGINGTKVVGSYIALGTPDWAVVTELPFSEAYQISIQRGELSAATTFVMMIVAAIVGVFVARYLTVPLIKLTNTASRIAQGEMVLQVDIGGPKEVASLATAFNSMTAKLRQTLGGLEQRVLERTRDLQLAADVAQNVSTLRDPTSLLTEAVEIIRERFDLYYVQIYLLDSSNRNLTLRAGTGEAGLTLLRRGHRLPIDLSSINGTAAIERRTVIVEDTATSLIHRANPLLPDTRSEMAIPLIAGENVVGVLDVQSNRSGALSAENLLAFQTLAGQLAIAIQNANLFAEAELARSESEMQARHAAQESWRDFLDAIEQKEYVGYVYEDANIQPLEAPLSETETESLLIPIQVSGEDLGGLRFEGKQALTEDDKAIGAAVVRQVAQQIENLRLLAQAERYQSEASDALRRMTREAWEDFGKTVRDSDVGFIYRNYEVKPLSQISPEEIAQFQAYPLQVRDQIIGEVTIDGKRVLSTNERELLDSIREQLSNHLENLRLTEQTQKALSDTELLYTASARIVQTSSMEDVLRAVVESSALKEFERAAIMLFNRVWENEPPEEGIIVGLWTQAGQTPIVPIGTVFPVGSLPLAAVMRHDVSLFIEDVETDERLDPRTRAIIGGISGRSVAFFPLVAGEQWFGFLLVGTSQLQTLALEESRQIQSLVSQAAAVIQSIRLYQQAQERAQREQTLRQITSAVRASTDPATIMRTAVRELGTALRRKTVVHLKKTASPPSVSGNGDVDDDAAGAAEPVQLAS